MEGRVQPAEQACNDAMAVDEKSRTAHIYCGDVFDFLKEHSKAVEHYRQALALNSADAATQAALGRHLYASGQAELGYAAFRRAQELSPGSKAIYTEWAGWLLAEQDYEGAHALYDQVIRLFPLDEEAHASKSFLYRCQGRFSESDKSELAANTLRRRNETVASAQERSAMSMMMPYSRLATPVAP